EIEDAVDRERRTVPRKLQAGHAGNAVLSVQPHVADDIFRARGGPDALFEYQRDDERDDAEIDVIDAAVNDEVAKDRGEDHRQADCGGKGPHGRARVQREDGVTIPAEPKEDRLPEAENPDITPE